MSALGYWWDRVLGGPVSVTVRYARGLDPYLPLESGETRGVFFNAVGLSRTVVALEPAYEDAAFFSMPDGAVVQSIILTFPSGSPGTIECRIEAGCGSTWQGQWQLGSIRVTRQERAAPAR